MPRWGWGRFVKEQGQADTPGTSLGNEIEEMSSVVSDELLDKKGGVDCLVSRENYELYAQETEKYHFYSNKATKIYPSLKTSSGSFKRPCMLLNEQQEHKPFVENYCNLSCKAGNTGIPSYSWHKDFINPEYTVESDSVEDLSYSEINVKGVIDLDCESNMLKELNNIESVMEKQNLPLKTDFFNKGLDSNDDTKSPKHNKHMKKGKEHNYGELTSPLLKKLHEVETLSDNRIHNLSNPDQCSDSVTVPSAPPSEDVSEASASVSIGSWSSHHTGFDPNPKQSCLPQGHLQASALPSHQLQTLSSCVDPQFREHPNYQKESYVEQHQSELPSSIIRILQERHMLRHKHQQQQEKPDQFLYGFSGQDNTSSVSAKFHVEQQKHLPQQMSCLSPHAQQQLVYNNQEHLYHGIPSFVSDLNQLSIPNKNVLGPFNENIHGSKSTHPVYMNNHYPPARYQSTVQPASSNELKDLSTQQSNSKHDSRSSDTLADLSSLHASLGKAPSSHTTNQMPQLQDPTAIQKHSDILKHSHHQACGSDQVSSSERFQKSAQILHRPPTCKDTSLASDDGNVSQIVRAQINSVYKNILSARASENRSIPRSDKEYSVVSSLVNGSANKHQGNSHVYLEQLIVEAMSRAADEAHPDHNKFEEPKSRALEMENLGNASNTQIEPMNKIDISSTLTQWVQSVASVLPSLAQIEGYIDYTIDDIGHALYSEIEDLVLGVSSVNTHESDTHHSDNRASRAAAATYSNANKTPPLSGQNYHLAGYLHNIPPTHEAHLPLASYQNVSTVYPERTVPSNESKQNHVVYRESIQNVKDSTQCMAAPEYLLQPAHRFSALIDSKPNQTWPHPNQLNHVADHMTQNPHPSVTSIAHSSNTNTDKNVGFQDILSLHRDNLTMYTIPAISSSQGRAMYRSSGLSEQTRAKLADLSLQYEQMSYSLPKAAPTSKHIGLDSGKSIISPLEDNEYSPFLSVNLTKSPPSLKSQATPNSVFTYQTHSLENMSGSHQSSEIQRKISNNGHSSNTETVPASLISSTEDLKKNSASHVLTPGVSRSQGSVGQRLYPRLDSNSFHSLSFKKNRRLRKKNRANGNSTSELLSSFIEEDGEDSTEADSTLAQQSYNTLMNSSVSSDVSQTSNFPRLPVISLQKEHQNGCETERGSMHSVFCSGQHFKVADETLMMQNQESSLTSGTKLIETHLKPPTVFGKVTLKPHRSAPVAPFVAKQQANLLRAAAGKTGSYFERTYQCNTPLESKEMFREKPVPQRPAPPVPVAKEDTKYPNQGFVMLMKNAFDQRARSVSTSPPKVHYRPAPIAPSQTSGKILQHNHSKQKSQQLEREINTTNATYLKTKVLPHTSNNAFQPAQKATSKNRKIQIFDGQPKQLTPNFDQNSLAISRLTAQARCVPVTENCLRKEGTQLIKSSTKATSHPWNTPQAPSFKMYSAASFQKANHSTKLTLNQLDTLASGSPHNPEKGQVGLSKSLNLSKQPSSSNSLNLHAGRTHKDKPSINKDGLPSQSKHKSKKRSEKASNGTSGV